jgi:hypothetical protein
LKRVVLADRLFKKSPLVRYEDFIAAPTHIARRLLDETGQEGEPPAQAPAGSITFGANHILAGNPDKFERGEMQIRPPSDWSQVLGPRARAAVTAATLPLLRRYGYPPWTELQSGDPTVVRRREFSSTRTTHRPGQRL